MANLRTLGIDLGTNSIGWSLIETNGEPGEDITAGVLLQLEPASFRNRSLQAAIPSPRLHLPLPGARPAQHVGGGTVIWLGAGPCCEP